MSANCRLGIAIISITTSGTPHTASPPPSAPPSSKGNYFKPSSHPTWSPLTELNRRTVPHESVVDRILHPELRDRMILLRGMPLGVEIYEFKPIGSVGRFNLVECLMEYRHEVIIHGDDVLVHQNWEISEKWLRKYGYVFLFPFSFVHWV